MPSPACRRSGTPLWSRTLCWKRAERRRARDVKKALEWLAPLQILDVKGDWAAQRPDVAPRRLGVPIRQSPIIPTSTTPPSSSTAMDRLARETGEAPSGERVARARAWIEGLQSKNGGWGAFDADNTPLLPQPHSLRRSRRAARSADRRRYRALRLDAGAAWRYARVERAAGARSRLSARRTGCRTAAGSAAGAANYIYGAWSSLCALNAAALPLEHDSFRRAVGWLVSIQNPDGGWGEDLSSYKLDYRGYEPAPSTALQTAWAAAGADGGGRIGPSPALKRGVAYLQETQAEHGLWNEARFTATGFPRVFYLRYHGYAKFFPLWALARYRNLLRANDRRVDVGL